MKIGDSNQRTPLTSMAEALRFYFPEPSNEEIGKAIDFFILARAQAASNNPLAYQYMTVVAFKHPELIDKKDLPFFLIDDRRDHFQYLASAYLMETRPDLFEHFSPEPLEDIKNYAQSHFSNIPENFYRYIKIITALFEERYEEAASLFKNFSQQDDYFYTRATVFLDQVRQKQQRFITSSFLPQNLEVGAALRSKITGKNYSEVVLHGTLFFRWKTFGDHFSFGPLLGIQTTSSLLQTAVDMSAALSINIVDIGYARFSLEGGAGYHSIVRGDNRTSPLPSTLFIQSGFSLLTPPIAEQSFGIRILHQISPQEERGHTLQIALFMSHSLQ